MFRRKLEMKLPKKQSAFCEEHPNTQAIVVSQDKKARKIEVNDKAVITILPWREFLQKLWSNKIMQSTSR